MADEISKPAWQSKTVILNAILGVFAIVSALGFIPGVDAWVQAHQDLVLMGISGIGIALRLVSSGKVSIWQ